MNCRHPFFVVLALFTFACLGANAQTFTVLHAFTDTPDGANPQGALLIFPDGAIYGTTANGGIANAGTVFKIDSSNNEVIVHNFTGTDGQSPVSRLIRDSVGTLYGTTDGGGTALHGTVFRLNPRTGKEEVLHSFGGAPDGQGPLGGLVRDSSGNLYGTTSQGGTGNCSIISFWGCGVVFKLDPTGAETILHNFVDGMDGAVPTSGLVMGANGELYGITYGVESGGTVFEIDSSGNFRAVNSAYLATTRGDPILGKNGLLYGTALVGFNSGIVYAVAPNGAATVLYTFSAVSDGQQPYSGVIQDKAGNLYGTTYGGNDDCASVVFKLDAKTHAYTTLHCFNSATDGAGPIGALVQDSAGNLYGTTSVGGPTGKGTVFKITP